MQFVVKGSKSRQTKWFHCNEDAYEFLDECEWDDAEVLVCYPVKRKPKETVFDSRCKDAAVKYLELRGYEIVDREFGTPYGDIDIIARDEDDMLVFVAVNASDDVGSGFVTPKYNREDREKSAMFYTEFNELEANVEVRFDTVSMLVCGGFDRALVRHHVNVYNVGR